MAGRVIWHRIKKRPGFEPDNYHCIDMDVYESDAPVKKTLCGFHIEKLIGEPGSKGGDTTCGRCRDMIQKAEFAEAIKAGTKWPPISIGTGKSSVYDDSRVIDDDAFLLDDGRPAVAQVWAECGYNYLSYFFSNKDLESMSKEELFAYLAGNGIKLDAHRDEDRYFVKSAVDNKGEPYWNFTLKVGESSSDSEAYDGEGSFS